MFAIHSIKMQNTTHPALLDHDYTIITKAMSQREDYSEKGIDFDPTLSIKEPFLAVSKIRSYLQH